MLSCGNFRGMMKWEKTIWRVCSLSSPLLQLKTNYRDFHSKTFTIILYIIIRTKSLHLRGVMERYTRNKHCVIYLIRWSSDTVNTQTLRLTCGWRSWLQTHGHFACVDISCTQRNYPLLRVARGDTAHSAEKTGIPK